MKKYFMVKRINLTLTEKLNSLIVKAAREDNRSVNNWIRQAIKYYLNRSK